jgi:trigger factor
MKTELTDVSETQKTLAVEIPTDVVDAEIGRIARDYTRKARVPGFRPGKVPASVVKQRFREEILHDVMHDLIPRAVEEALQERGIEPVETPNIKDVTLKEGQPLTFTASIETVPPFDPGDLSTLTATRPSTVVGEDAVDDMLKRLQQRAAKYESIEGRPIGEGDTVTLDIERRDATGEPERHENVTLQMGAEVNPPGFDQQLLGLDVGATRTFPLRFPDDYAVTELAGAEVTYTVSVKELRRRVVPELDDELAKDIGEFDSLGALRARVRTDLEAEAAEHAARQVRSDIMKQLAERVSFEPPSSLLEHEIDRRLEEFARQLVQQNVDPRQAGIDWSQFREAQRAPARAAVAGALALDEVARRESLTVTPDDVDKEVERFAIRARRTPAALRAQLEKEGGMSRLQTGLRREKAVDLALSRARIVEA